MNKTELTAALRARQPWMRETDARQIVDALLGPNGIIAEELTAGRSVTIPGFGTFEVHIAAARTGRNPSTGEPIQIPAHRRVVFRSGKGLKARVAG